MNAPKKVAPTGAQSAPAPRRSSFQVLMSDFEHLPNRATVPRPELTTQKSSVKDYRSLKTAEERVTACVRTYQREVLSVHGSKESTLAFNEQTIEDFMERQKACGLSESEVHLVLVRVAYLQVVEKAEYDPYRILSLLFKTIMGYVDLATDIATMAYYITRKPMIAAAQGAILLFSFVVQSASSLSFGQPLWVGLMGLVGMKPALEAWRDATGAEQFEGQKLGNFQFLFLCRVLEMLAETIPQALVQVIALLTTDRVERTSIQYVSLAISLVTAGSTVAFADRALDLNAAARRGDPLLYGYVPSIENGRFLQLLAMIMFFSTYVGSKMFALAVLLTRGGIAFVAVWLVAEFAVLLGLRVGIGNWRTYRKGADGVGFSAFLHLMLHISLVFAPFPIFRNPAFLTSRVYSGSLLYVLLANFMQVGIAFRRGYDEGSVDEERTAWGVLSALTAVCVVSGGAAYRYVPPSLKKTFYEHLTLKEHVASFWWNEGVELVEFTKKGVYNNLEAVRAYIPTVFPECYIPKERCKAFYVENWARWEQEQPDWFDEDFKATVPRAFRPDK